MKRTYAPALVAQIFILSSLTIAAASAAEVIVKNDSFTDGGAVNVQAGFYDREQAAVWLTSPCNGRIVGIQVFWGPMGNGLPSVEDSITIYRPGVFPNPDTSINGTLAVLEAPVLTPGFMNEFRYLDENNTVPINIPVTAGQTFVVAFKFFNPPAERGGSICTDVNGCQNGKNGLYAIPPGLWFNACTLGVSGDFVIRAIVDCAAATGACCKPDGTCAPLTAAQCSQVGGTYQGDNVSCGSVNCPQPTGACCFAATQGCLNLTQAQCQTAGGVWAGAGTSCATYVCFPRGACCLPNGSCVDNVSPQQCTAQGGTFKGNGTTCGTVSCPPPTGACCFGTGGCLVLVQADCQIAGGSWKGAGTNCADGNQNGAPDACESNVRPGDLNCDGVVNFDDIDPFVVALTGQAAYEAEYPGCRWLNADCNNDGQVNFNDIDAFVNLLSGG